MTMQTNEREGSSALQNGDATFIRRTESSPEYQPLIAGQIESSIVMSKKERHILLDTSDSAFRPVSISVGYQTSFKESI